MKKKLEMIVGLLPDGLSETGIQEICSLIQDTIDEAVDTEQKVLESKVTSYLSTKIDELKEVAKAEVLNEMAEVKEFKVLQEIKSLIAPLLPSTDLGDMVAEHNEVVEKLEADIEALNETVASAFEDKGEVDELLSESAELLTSLRTEYEDLEESLSDMNLSESTVMIRQGDSKDIEEDTPNENQWLTEDVLKLSKEQLYG